jgi:membrane protease YdiL (CAAX protease family)
MKNLSNALFGGVIGALIFTIGHLSLQVWSLSTQVAKPTILSSDQLQNRIAIISSDVAILAFALLIFACWIYIRIGSYEKRMMELEKQAESTLMRL